MILRRTFKRTAGACLALAFAMQSANAAMIVSVDMDTATPGVQSEWNPADHPGVTSFSADLVMDVTGADIVLAYGISVQYDTAPMDATAATEGGPFGEFTTAHLSEGVEWINDDIGGGLGMVATIEANDVTGGGFALVNGSFLLGSIDFDLTTTRGAAGEIVPGVFNVGVDAVLDGAWGEVQDSVEFRSGFVLPEPSSVALLVLGGLTLLRRRR